MSGIPANVFKQLGLHGPAAERVPKSSPVPIDFNRILPWEHPSVLAPGIYSVPSPGAPPASPQNK